MKTAIKKKGYVTLMAILFMAVLLLVSVGLGGFAISYNRLQGSELNRAESFTIAEAGLDWVKWYLTHYPNDMDLNYANGTNDTYPGVITKDYYNEIGQKVGKYEIELQPNSPCGQVSAVDVYVTGWVLGDKNSYRKLFGRLARPSVAEFSYIYNSFVWAGDDRIIYGPYHSNGQVHMDGTNLSTVSSHLLSRHGHDGVYANASNPNPHREFWDFPVDEIDFGHITVDLGDMKNKATAAGAYYGPTPNGKHGYKVTLNGDEYIVEMVDNVYSYSTGNNSNGHTNYMPHQTHTITSPHTKIPVGCSVLFFDDDIWIGGNLDTLVTIGAKDPSPSRDAEVTIFDDITYSKQTGDAGLTLVSEGNIEIGITADSANDDSGADGDPTTVNSDLWLNGVFIAQNGRFGRDYYNHSYGGFNKREYSSDDQTMLVVNGTIVSNKRGGTKWTGGGGYMAGYEKRKNYYNIFTALNPPPLTPSTSQELEFVEWREVYK